MAPVRPAESFQGVPTPRQRAGELQHRQVIMAAVSERPDRRQRTPTPPGSPATRSGPHDDDRSEPGTRSHRHSAREGAALDHRPGGRGRAPAHRRCWPTATSWSRACRASPRRAPSRASRRRSRRASRASSSRRTCCPPTSPAREVYHSADGQGEFRFQPGPIFNNLILADEINRAPAKVQSALLEAMEERQVTVAGTTYKLPRLFMVMATQNPIEQEGTYPLPEAQMDRFLMHVLISYPDEASEARSAARAQRGGGRRRRKAGAAGREDRLATGRRSRPCSRPAPRSTRSTSRRRSRSTSSTSSPPRGTRSDTAAT